MCIQNYQIEIDKTSEAEWNKILTLFKDATIYQSWSYGYYRSSEISHVILKYNFEIVACAQVRIYKPPFLRLGIAYLYQGPLWRRKELDNNLVFLKEIAKTLVDEYAKKRNLYLKIILPYYNIDAQTDDIKNIFNEIGYDLNIIQGSHLVVPLEKSLIEIRKDLNQKWRNQLNVSEKKGIEVIEGYEEHFMHYFSSIYKEMCSRKKFDKPSTIDHFTKIFCSLPYNLRPLIILCRYQNNFVAGGIFSTLGTTGIYLYGATNEFGMKSKASYLVQWRILTWLKENKFSKYDLSGINAENNPGTYHFKAGICEKNGHESKFVGAFISCYNWKSKLFAKLINIFWKNGF